MAASTNPTKATNQVRHLPSARHKLAREFVVRSQRDRLLDAMAEASAAKGHSATTVADVIARAGVSRATFYVDRAAPVLESGG